MSDMIRRPLVVGLTGPIGCGKSQVMATLVALGALGIDADRTAHAVTAPGGPAHAAVVARFGAQVLGPAGDVDRQRLGQLVFADPAALADLERIVHPAVAEAIRAQVAAATAPMVVIEAIKLLEAGLSRALCDQIWVTACRPEQQVERLARSRGMTAEQVAARQASQMPLAEMVTQAHRVIDTSGSLAHTGLQTLAAWCELGLPLPAPAVRAGQDEDVAGMAALADAGPQQVSVLGMARASGPGHGARRAVVAEVAGVVLGYLALEPGPEPGGPAALAGAWLRSCPSTAASALAARAVEQARQARFAGLVARPEAGDAAALALLAGLGFQRRGPGEPEYELTW